MSEPIFMFDDDDPAMRKANEAAQGSFKYFWRELSWERRRIIPGLDMAMVKLPFTDGPRTDGHSDFEQMWIGEVGFDGETLTGELLNSPNWLTSVRQGDSVQVPFAQLTDWMMTVDGRAYGGFTVNAMRAKMGRNERKQHDKAWGLDFGDPTETQIEIERGKKSFGGFVSSLFGGRSKQNSQPVGFSDHPMCVNMMEVIEEQLQADRETVRTVNDEGFTLLHCDALAGNFGVVKLLVKYGADIAARTPSGRTASNLARGIGWSEIADYLDTQSNV
ncbi:Ankyrin repeat protein [Symmachiella dynata]|uniref:Ankyrin repeat protein n=2 Tax=Symmachiella dynata TaxID=2527995 RepID=A0A517ZW69_9PLAN|nr:Ankyrin repeat protein [Symmachiella dynata]